ncbi:lipopeptide mating pheromone precursor Bbp2-6 [Schizophyllum commune H4-8]|uniref:Lipopeptide mating pheromone bbp2-6 n=2 Tax=Schizophyllum commune TaxID=5334 RepID=D8QF40_SCHCM|nr:lipopeptide mating pheromone precursor Bbp2-6 [Schizophyllum commune H4-8]AAR99652.1 lipopeptide mating pheromone precursor Bbp2(6) [Schizophyllum commune]KAI5887470.1 lipopeptide mating pheromone precursor Bbp2-6 [Schizophyllum commune H4-8]
MSAAAPTTANQPKRNPAIQALVTSAPSDLSSSSTPSDLSSSSDAPQSPALTPRGGYYVSRTTGRAELKDAEREGDGNMTYFCEVM